MNKMPINPISGSALILILVTVALFGALSWAWSQSSRTSGGWLRNEQSNASTTALSQCDATVSMATKRLEARGCGNYISLDEDGDLLGTAGEPSDGSCALYHPKGGGVKSCSNLAAECMLSLAVGESCSGVVYAGISGGRRIYAHPTDNAATVWDNGANQGLATSPSDGLANTDFLVGNTGGLGYPYSAAIACRSLGGKYYLPAPDEMDLLYTVRNIGDFNGTFNTSGAIPDSLYWTSQSQTSSNAYRINMSNGGNSYSNRTNSRVSRCVRRD